MQHIGRLAGLALVIALGGGLSAAVEAQQQNGMGQGMGMHHGMQGDGPMDMAERFGEADADGDGKVSRDEMVTRMTERATGRIEARVDRMIAYHDGDGDGMLTLEEMRAGPAGRMFDRLDADGNGAVSREEFARMREMRGKMRRGKGRGMHHGMHQGMRHGEGDGMARHSLGKGSVVQGDLVIHHHYHEN
ncbi:EF-hand domain-containing protein [Roseovarius ramblicola]|uniref:EF-hand domain-containing protein n=1 Tax=Roseovarius ramblicola TaxID=2022336 RepID=A0ABV5I1Z6_9RHOB